MSELTAHQREVAAKVRDVLRYYLAESPLPALALADKLGHWGSRESRRRRGRDAIRWAREIYGQEIGSCAGGYYLSRTREDRLAAKDFLRRHGLSELYTASLAGKIETQGVLPV